MIINVPLTKLSGNPWQTRVGEPDAEYVKTLALDIAQNGLLQAPVGRLATDKGEGNYVPVDADDLHWGESIVEMKLHEGNALVVQLAFGHNRWAAYKWLYELKDNSNIPGDFSKMPVDIRALNDQQMAIMAWSENEKRRDVSPIERARAIELRMADFEWSQTEVADQLGLARPTVSNILRLLKLPERIQDALHKGKISARAAEALMPMYALPKETLQLAELDWVMRPSRIEKEAMDGISSDTVRADVQRLYDRWTVKLQGAEFGLDEVYPEDLVVSGYDFEGNNCKVHWGTCRTCDMRLKDQGNICLDKGCYRAKETLYRRRYLATAAAASGFEVSDHTKGGNVTRFPTFNDEAKIQNIIESGCKNLKLVYEAYPGGGSKVRYVKNFPHALIVCDKRNDSCTCLNGLELKGKVEVRVGAALQREREEDADYEEEQVEAEAEGEVLEDTGAGVAVRAQTGKGKELNPKELEEVVKQARKDKAAVLKELGNARIKVAKVLVDALRGDEPGAFRLIAERSLFGGGTKKLDDLYRMIANNHLGFIVPLQATSIEELYKLVNTKLEMLGLECVYPYETLVEIFEEKEVGNEG